MIKINRVNSYRAIRVAKYIRLSREDGDDRESESVENQRDIIDNYILEHEELIEAGEYVDDGYTGTNFNRPDFQRMIKDIENRLYYNKRLIKIWKGPYRHWILFRKIFTCKQYKIHSNWR